MEFDARTWFAIRERQRQQQLRALRFFLLRPLRLVGAKAVTGAYDGVGDSGSTETIEIDGGAILGTPDLVADLEDFVWEVACHLHPGFEINAGGFGQFHWEIPQDRITLEHGCRIEDVHYTSHDGI
jgi:hypothetical protein